MHRFYHRPMDLWERSTALDLLAWPRSAAAWPAALSRG
jgi:hypothetical protein